MKRKINIKGFTLVELLAVIVILGVIMGIAFPAVTGIISSSRDSAFIDSAEGLIAAAATKAQSNNGQYLPQKEGLENAVVIYVSDLDTEKSTKQSSYGSSYVDDYCFVLIVGTNKGYDYYITLLDKKDHFLNGIKQEDLNTSKITRYNGDPKSLVYDPTKYKSLKNDKGDIYVYLGDVNGDMVVDQRDYQACELVLKGTTTLTSAEKIALDCASNQNGRTVIVPDGKITIEDCSVLHQVAKGTRSSNLGVGKIGALTPGYQKFVTGRPTPCTYDNRTVTCYDINSTK